jgi:copper chaperone
VRPEHLYIAANVISLLLLAHHPQLRTSRDDGLRGPNPAVLVIEECTMIELKVTGMTCGGCVNSVKKAIGRVYPTVSVDVDLGSGRVQVGAAQSSEAGSGAVELSRARIEQAIVAAGFGVEGA